MPDNRADPPIEDLEDLYENAPFGYLSLSKRGRIVKANRTLSVLTGHAQSELVGMRIHDLLNIAGRMYFETHLAPLLRIQGNVDEVALDLVARDGCVIPVLANAAERRDQNGDLVVTRWALFQADARRRYERELLSARNLAADAIRSERATSELREQFIAVLGHDLRNPLASIASGLRLLKREPLSDRAREVLSVMDGSVVRASDLISDVLDFARGKLGDGIVLVRRPDEPLQRVVQQVVDEACAIAPDRRIESSVVIESQVDCDPVRIGQLVSNLLGNAITHGSVELPIRFSARTTEGKLSISVSNGGEPIPETAMTNLFQPFFRGAVHNSQQGLGLGLFIAAQIASAHGGDLTVRSTHEETRFDFVMPLLAGSGTMSEEGSP